MYRQRHDRLLCERYLLRTDVIYYLTTIEYDYPTFHLRLQYFWCQIVEGTPVLKEHEAARWLDPDKIASVDWLPADLTIIPAVAALLEKDAYFDRISGWVHLPWVGFIFSPGIQVM